MILEIECQECNGYGFTEELNCTAPASMCCGSCHVKVKCDQCDGLGNYDVEFDINDVRPFLESKEIYSEKA